MSVKFANSIDKDILTALDSINKVPNEPITNNYIKCSKSVVPNAFYYIGKGEQVELFLGSMTAPWKDMITHCWIEHNGQVCQTHVPEPDVKLFKNFSITLSNDIEKAKKEIRDLIEFILV